MPGLPENVPASEASGRRPVWVIPSAVVAVLALVWGGVSFSGALAARSRRDRLVADARILYQAIARYEDDHGAPPLPGTSTASGLNLRTLAPLATTGYLPEADSILARLRDERVTAYDATGAQGRGFWLVLTDRTDPSVQVLAARTDSFPLAAESWIEGIFAFEGDALRKLAPPPAPRDGSARAEPRP